MDSKDKRDILQTTLYKQKAYLIGIKYLYGPTFYNLILKLSVISKSRSFYDTVSLVFIMRHSNLFCIFFSKFDTCEDRNKPKLVHRERSNVGDQSVNKSLLSSS